METDQKPSLPQARRRERDERPKNNPKEDLGYRISGLEKAKAEPEMSRADVAALDRAIVKLKEKLAAKEESKKKENDAD